ncbi:ABC transporter ATP-binding protein [Acuticoccus mangrovi]|uniref:ABC transporter ATP-binding protein n=1 Tax=Acuticoccus mangrovi TaxID=2796142 RepID=A0A934IMB1_9HYPH|nr:ABC transporter ATP-binding protein [Acuticoccus mangrovi]MBJ3775250.1 ABC transporter ATP-binding protein [Acuticoccus mangrovi]
MADDLLAVSGLNTYYGGAHILSDVAFAIGGNEVVALLGRNGAGKSTTIKSVMGLVRPRSGSVVYQGEEIAGDEPYRVCRRGIGYVPEERRVFSELTVEENLEVGRRPPRADASEWTPERLYALFPNLAERRRHPAGRMSGGEQQMLTIARTLMGNPRLVLLDEPSEGIAPLIVEQMAMVIKELKREGLAVLISEQNLHFARIVSDRAVIIEKGAVRFTGTFADLDANPDIAQATLAL